MQRRSLIGGTAGVLLLTLAPWEIARGAHMVAVRMWPAEEYTRVTLESDAPLKFRHFFVRSSNPLRFVVDIEDLQLTDALKKQIAGVEPGDPYIAAMRIGQFSPGVVRLVMDLKTDVKPEVFLLKPFGEYKYRLVFDIYPATPVDEISKILASQDEPQGDPLADMLASLSRNTSGPPPAEPPQAPKKTEPAPSGSSAASKPAAPAQSARAPSGKAAAAGSKPSAAGTEKTETQTAKAAPKSAPAVRGPVRRTPELVVVVDPGHGGEDPGAIGSRKTKEKTVVLQIGRRLAQLINNEPGMRSILTRNTDHFVSLGGRVAIASKARAHLLVSIHADAWMQKSARGSSVFALSQKGATSAAARWLAKSQNESDLIGGVNISTVNRQVATVLVDMTSNWTISYSLGLGASVLKEIKGINRLHKNQVEQAGFAVLKGQGIPSILVETAFISNPEEERLLTQAKHQEKIARAILTGIKKQLRNDPSILRG